MMTLARTLMIAIIPWARYGIVVVVIVGRVTILLKGGSIATNSCVITKSTSRLLRNSYPLFNMTSCYSVGAGLYFPVYM